MCSALTTGEAVDMHHGLRAVSVDVITEYAFGESYDLLDMPDLGLKFFTLVHKIGPAAWVFRQWPWLKKIAMMAPEKIVKLLSEPMGQIRDMQNMSFDIISEVNHADASRQHFHEQLCEVTSKLKGETGEGSPRPTIFSALLTAAEQPETVKTDNVVDEAYTVLTAAADTTGNAMTTILRHVVSDPVIYKKIHMELKTTFPDRTRYVDYAVLEKLPYLVSKVSWLPHTPAISLTRGKTNVIKEGLRSDHICQIFIFNIKLL